MIGELVAFEDRGWIGTYGDVVASSLTRETPVEDLQVIANLIGHREGFTEFGLYSSEEAVRAAFSDSYRQASPEAWECVLGSWKGGLFTPTTH